MAFNKITIGALLAVALVAAQAYGCQVKDVQSTSYTTTDGLVISDVAYITNFQVQCSDPSKSESLTLFADIGSTGKTLPVIRATDGKSYQISWTEEMKKASSATFAIKVYDEEGFSLLRKAQRTAEGGADPNSVKPLLTLSVSHPGIYRGPWLQTELIASILAVTLWWLAYSAKSKLIA